LSLADFTSEKFFSPKLGKGKRGRNYIKCAIAMTKLDWINIQIREGYSTDRGINRDNGDG